MLTSAKHAMYCYSMTTDATFEECRSDCSHQVSIVAMIVAAWPDPSSLQGCGLQARFYNILRWVFNGIISYQTPLLVPYPFIFMHQAKKFGADISLIPYFSPFGPPSHSPCLLVSASHRNFSVRVSCAEWELLKWAALGQYKSAFHELFTKSFVTALILTGSTWLQFFVRSCSIRKGLIYSKKATTINYRDENTTTTLVSRGPTPFRKRGKRVW